MAVRELDAFSNQALGNGCFFSGTHQLQINDPKAHLAVVNALAEAEGKLLESQLEGAALAEASLTNIRQAGQALSKADTATEEADALRSAAKSHAGQLGALTKALNKAQKKLEGLEGFGD